MPEGPEVALIVDSIKQKFSGQNIENIKIISGKYLIKENNIKDLKFPLINTQINCKGKLIYWTFDNTDMAIFNHLAMTGSYSLISNKYSAIEISFKENKLYFNDIRKFGIFEIKSYKYIEHKLSKLGWDVLKEDVPSDIVSKFRKFNKITIAVALLRPDLICSSGNYLRCEALGRAKISPFRLVRDLSDQEIKNLCQEFVGLVKASYAHGGASLLTFRNLYGTEGSFAKKLQFYGQKKDPFGNPIIKEKDKSGRTISYSSVQK